MNTANRILMVEDDADDRELLREAVLETNPDVEFAVAENGLQAMDYLASVKEGSAKSPCLIVLDLNMPFLDGAGTFSRIQSDIQLKKIPIIIFTSSSSPHDKSHYTSQGAEFISKPEHFNKLLDIARHMVDVCSNCA
jgi:CheY-like chemotaxis protein